MYRMLMIIRLNFKMFPIHWMLMRYVSCLFVYFPVFMFSLFLEQCSWNNNENNKQFFFWNFSIGIDLCVLINDSYFSFHFSWMKWNYFEWNAETNNNFHSFRRKKKTLREKKTFRKTKQQQKKSFFYSCVSVNFLCLVSLLNNIFPPPTHKDISFIHSAKEKK